MDEEKRGRRRRQNDPTGVDALIVALGHPDRRKILQMMPADTAISPRELSSLLRIPLSNVGYHVRILAECGAIRLVDTRPVRGSMQHFYVIDIEADWAREALGLDTDR